MLLNIKQKLISRKVIKYGRVEGLTIQIQTDKENISIEAENQEEVNFILEFLADETFGKYCERKELDFDFTEVSTPSLDSSTYSEYVDDEAMEELVDNTSSESSFDDEGETEIYHKTLSEKSISDKPEDFGDIKTSIEIKKSNK